ncbi:MAG: hypothetical protein ACTTJZ_01400 [Sphaerochaetaceae bacterium]
MGREGISALSSPASSSDCLGCVRTAFQNQGSPKRSDFIGISCIEASGAGRFRSGGRFASPVSLRLNSPLPSQPTGWSSQ